MSAIKKTWIETQPSRATRGGRPTYRVRWQDDHGTHSRAGFTSKRKAREFVDELRGQAAADDYVSPVLGQITVREWLARFLATWTGKRSTRAGYAKVIDAYVNRPLLAQLDPDDRGGRPLRICLGDVKLRDLNLDVLNRWKLILSAQTARSGPNVGKLLSPRTIYQAIAVLRKALNDAAAVGVIGVDPIPRRFAPAAADPDTNAFETLAEYETFLGYVDPSGIR